MPNDDEGSSEVKSPPSHFAGLRCPKCAYELTGLGVNICPECGTVFDPGGLRAYQTWDNPRYRKIAIILLALTSMVLLLQFVAMNWGHTSPSHHSHSNNLTLWQFAMRVNVSINRLMPCFVLPVLLLLSFIVTFKATAVSAHKSALIAFLAVILCGFGLFQQWALVVWSI